jgi:uncharacterized protein YqjF (DUF2071 family)
MNAIDAVHQSSVNARRRLLSIRGEPLFYANWVNAVFIHHEIDPKTLQSCIPYQLDLFEGRAFVSLVAFTMRRMRPRFGGQLSEILFKPIATHSFLNVRTYVRHRGEPAIYFMREWVSNRVSVALGPLTFGLPYRFGAIAYEELGGRVWAKEGELVYRTMLSERDFGLCEAGSLDEFLLERYTAFTQTGLTKRFFRIWHEPWQKVSAKTYIARNDLLRANWNWWKEARCVGTSYSPGVEVWMGWPHRIERLVT